MRRNGLIAIITVLLMVLIPIQIVEASMTFTVDDTYLRGSITAYLPDTENTYSLEVSGPGGTFNKNNAGVCYHEDFGKITIDYGYMEKGSKFTMKLTDQNGTDAGMFTFTIKAKTKGTFLVQPPNDAPTPTPIPSPTPEPTRTPESTPTPVPPIILNTPTPSPEPTEKPKPTETPNPTEVPATTPEPTPEPTPTETPTPTPTPIPTATPTPIPTDTPTPVPTPTEEPTEPISVTAAVIVETEPSDTEPPKETEGKNVVVKKIEDAAVKIPGIYKEETSSKVRVKLDVAIASIAVTFLIGFAVMFVVRLAKESKKISVEAFFRGGLSEESEEDEE